MNHGSPVQRPDLPPTVERDGRLDPAEIDLAELAPPPTTESWRPRTWHYLLGVVIGLAVVAGLSIWQMTRPAGLEQQGASPITIPGGAGGPGPDLGKPAPDFTLQDLAGNTVRLSDLRGRPVLINFWATWCAPCRTEMPELDAVARERGPERLRVLLVDFQEDPQEVQRYVDTLGLSLVPLLDRDGAVARAYRVGGLPTSFFVDSAGGVRHIQIGPMTRRLIEARLAEMDQ